MPSHTTARRPRVLIIGGGFGGLRAARELGRRHVHADVTLVTDKPFFEYYPTLYKVVTGYSSRQSAVSYAEVLGGLPVSVVTDRVSSLNLKGRRVESELGHSYPFDHLVLAVGAETGYFNIPGLPEFSHGFKSLSEALKLKAHVAATIASIAGTEKVEDKVKAAHFMVVGGGPTGCEVSAELLAYGRELAKNHGVDPGLITVDLIEAAPRLLPIMPPDISASVWNELHRCGVNIYLNRTVIRQEVEELFLKDMSARTRTVIWTAGVKPNSLLDTAGSLERDRRGRVEVDSHLQAKGHPGVYVVGDAAATEYSGMAQTANHDGKFVAEVISAKLSRRTPPAYVPQRPVYAIPAGRKWAAILWGNVRIRGRLAWYMRHLADLRYMLTILPPAAAFGILERSEVRADSER